MIEYVEDLITDVTRNNPDVLPSTELKIFNSLRKQLNKQLYLTERQYHLVLKKIEKNHSAFIEKYHDIDNIASKVKYPFREIDRSRWIRFTRGLMNSETYPYITIRALYSKSLMRAFDDIAKQLSCQFFVDHPGKKRHYRYTEAGLAYIVERLSGMNFDVDPLVMQTYDRIKSFDKTKRYPKIKNGEIHNLPENAIKRITDELGPVNKENLILYKDREILNGIKVEDTLCYKNVSSVTRRIATRKSGSIHINSKEIGIHEIADSLASLRRLPALYLVDRQDAAKSTRDAIESFGKHVPAHDISVCINNPFNNRRDISELMDQYGVMHNVRSNTQLVIALSSTVSPYLPILHWDPKCVIISESTKILQTAKVISLYSYVDLTIDYTERLHSQLSTVLKTHHNKVVVV